MNQITFLGTGTSTGVPIPGCKCKVCQSTNSKDKRFRTSAYLQTANKACILIDTSPDLRSQLLKHGIDRLDGVIFTHTHADHVHGIDDLRPLCYVQNKTIPCFAGENSYQELINKFPYIFNPKYDKPIGGGVPKLTLNQIPQGEGSVLNNDFIFCDLPHGHFKTTSIIHNKMAYATDCAEIPKSYLEKLKNLKLELFFIDCTRMAPHQTHLHLDKAIEYAKFVGAKTTGLIHLSHDFEHDELNNKLKVHSPNEIRAVFDGEIFFYS